MKPFHYLAQMINPKYIKDNLLTSKEEVETEYWLVSIFPVLLQGNLAFKMRILFLIYIYK